MTFEIFLAFWQKVSAHLEFPGTQAGEDASYSEWTEGNHKFYGMRKVGGGQKHGIVRTIRDGSITEATYYEDKQHGLIFVWYDHPSVAFQATIYDHGNLKACIMWREDWSVYDSMGDKELILGNNGLSIFKK